jgi:excisionase family DNA binding protein
MSKSSSIKQNPVPEPIGLPIAQAAAYLGVAPRQIRTLIYSRELNPIRLGRRFVFRTEDLKAFLDKKAQESA